MEVTLRKAAALSAQALEQAKGIVLKRSASISIYDPRPVAEIVNSEVRAAKTNLAKAVSLIEAAYRLRALIAEVNQQSGVATLLAGKASAEAVEKVYQGLATPKTASNRYGGSVEGGSIAVVESQVNALREKGVDAYSLQTVDATLIDQEFEDEISLALSTIRREKISISDRLAEINNSVKVTIPAETFVVFQDAGLV